MGNTPSTNTRPTTSASHSHSHSPSGHNHDSSKAASTRRDPRNLIQSQRSAARAEPSLAQAHGSNVTHRPRNSQSHPAGQFGTSYQEKDPQMSIQPKDEPPTERIDVKDQPTKPVDVPMPSSYYDSKSLRSHSDSLSQSLDPSGPPLQDMSYHLTRPPRLPLPIEEEVHTPGSPIIAPTENIDAPVLDIETLDNEPLPRRTSALSNNTIEEEEDAELPFDKTKATVPTIFEWREGGEKVTSSVGGAHSRLRRTPLAIILRCLLLTFHREGEPGLLRAIIHVRPGTHHVRFIADGAMKCSTLLPTTVDFGNNLVNYIEVSADDLPRDETPAEIPNDPIGGGPNNAETPQAEPTPSEEKAEPKPASRMKPVTPEGQYTSQIPQYLIDMDKPEDSEAYQYAIAAIDKLPSPPSLPGFLGKPILNAATPMKDDNSVLTMPNHTVLNHLATSSIKNNVLAVSATTRYKRKYVTTIMYKPTGEDRE
ncbi:hypothetical protein CJF32_00005923 [Rutstroemia sp. NJR-2017a WRK4]|nr:hypothetical protein CJF32_00005923 [Rutstroemia sp. NJR-2017a WRK4]